MDKRGREKGVREKGRGSEGFGTGVQGRRGGGGRGGGRTHYLPWTLISDSDFDNLQGKVCLFTCVAAFTGSHTFIKTSYAN